MTWQTSLLGRNAKGQERVIAEPTKALDKYLKDSVSLYQLVAYSTHSFSSPKSIITDIAAHSLTLFFIL